MDVKAANIQLHLISFTARAAATDAVCRDSAAAAVWARSNLTFGSFIVPTEGRSSDDNLQPAAPEVGFLFLF